jgi:hypothetical protein
VNGLQYNRLNADGSERFLAIRTGEDTRENQVDDLDISGRIGSVGRVLREPHGAWQRDRLDVPDLCDDGDGQRVFGDQFIQFVDSAIDSHDDVPR